MNATWPMKMAAGFGYAKALTGFVIRSSSAPGGPVSVALEPTNLCNLRCPLCAAGSNSLTRQKGCISLEDFEKIINKLPASVKELYLWGQGEPFMAPDFIGMIRCASARGFKTIVSTNGHFLDAPREIVQSGLDVLIVSLDGVNQDTYTSYRIGGDFNRVVDGITGVAKKVKEIGYGPVIELQCLVTCRTAGEIEAFKSLAYRIGAHRIVFKTMQAASMENGSSYLPDDMKHTRYRIKADGNLEPDKLWFLKNRCLRFYYSFQIDWQGNVLPCCFDKDSTYVMGNVFKDSVANIWNSENYRSFRDKINRQGRVLPMCKDCTEGLKRFKIIDLKFRDEL